MGSEHVTERKDHSAERETEVAADGHGAEPATSPESSDAAQSARTPGRQLLGRLNGALRNRKIVAGCVVAGLVILACLAAFQYWGNVRPDRATESTTSSVTQVASDSAVSILSYKHGSVDEDVKRAQGLLTGEFAEYYKDFTSKVVVPAAKEKSVDTQASVVGSAVQSASPDHAVVLLFVNQSTVTAENASPSLTASSVRVELEESDGRWLVSKFDPV